MFAHGETVTVLDATLVVDPYSGEPTGEQDWSTPTTRTVDQVAVADGGSLEPESVARNEVESDYDLMFPADDPITSASHVIVRGVTCDVVGRPFLWRSPFTGWTPGLVVKVKAREG